MKSNKGFTLIELLAVLVIMAIILGIGIPSVIKLIESRSRDEYNVQKKLVNQALNLYQDRYKAKLDQYIDRDCFSISYQDLIDEGLLDEKDVKCSGTIILTRKVSSDPNAKRVNRFKQDYYLDCKDESRNYAISNDANSVPANTCLNLSIGQSEIVSPSIPVPSIKSNATANTWQTTDITVTFSSTPDSSYNYQYFISDNPIIPSNEADINNVVNNQVVINENGTHYIWFRAVDKTDTNKVSNWSNMVEVNIDKVTPATPKIVASDDIASDVAHPDSFVLVFGGGNNPSGNTYYYGWSSASITSVADPSYIEIDIDAIASTQTLYVKSCSKANLSNCSAVAQYVVKK